jgi:hypothetical protein
MSLTVGAHFHVRTVQATAYQFFYFLRIHPGPSAAQRSVV